MGKRRQKDKGGKRRRGVRTRPEDKTKSRAIDELKAKRSAGELGGAFVHTSHQDDLNRTTCVLTADKKGSLAKTAGA